MTNDELKMIIEKHEKWLKNQEGGERADLRGADLLGAKLYGLFQCHTLMAEVLQRCFGSRNVQLIDRQAALEIAMCYCPDDDGSCSKEGHDIREMLDEIEALPAIEAESVRHGHWVIINPLYSNVYCSECGASADKYIAKWYKGCPFCLCVMDATDTNVDGKGGANNG